MSPSHAGMVPLAIGTDAGGSSRRPPAHVGLVGLKGTLGAIPYGPGFPEATVETSVISPITRDVADCALVFEVLAGIGYARSRFDCDVAELPVLHRSPRDIRIAYRADLRAGCSCRSGGARQRGRTRHDDWRREASVSQRLDPVWPEGAAETGLMPIQHAALAAIHGEAWKRDPSAIDPDLGAQIAAGFAYRPEEIMRALLLSQAVARASAAFFSQKRSGYPAGADDSLHGLAVDTAWTCNDRWRAGRTAGTRGLHAPVQPQPPARDHAAVRHRTAMGCRSGCRWSPHGGRTGDCCRSPPWWRRCWGAESAFQPR